MCLILRLTRITLYYVNTFSHDIRQTNNIINTYVILSVKLMILSILVVILSVKLIILSILVVILLVKQGEYL